MLIVRPNFPRFLSDTLWTDPWACFNQWTGTVKAYINSELCRCTIQCIETTAVAMYGNKLLKLAKERPIVQTCNQYHGSFVRDENTGEKRTLQVYVLTKTILLTANQFYDYPSTLKD